MKKVFLEMHPEMKVEKNSTRFGIPSEVESSLSISDDIEADDADGGQQIEDSG
jgi:hypothetical protein